MTTGLYPPDRNRYRCPGCGDRINLVYVTKPMYSGFACPYCGEWVAVSLVGPKTVLVACFLVSLCILYISGMRSLSLLAVTVIASLLLWPIGRTVAASIYPRRLERRPRSTDKNRLPL